MAALETKEDFCFVEPGCSRASREEQESRDLHATAETNASSLFSQHGFLPKVGPPARSQSTGVFKLCLY